MGFIVTNLSLPSRAVVRFYNKRGTAEQWIKAKLSLVGEAFNVFNFSNVYTVSTQQYTYTGPGTGVCGAISRPWKIWR